MPREAGKTAWCQWTRALLGRWVHPVGLRAAGGRCLGVSARVLWDRSALDLSPPCPPAAPRGAAGSCSYPCVRPLLPSGGSRAPGSQASDSGRPSPPAVLAPGSQTADRLTSWPLVGRAALCVRAHTRASYTHVPLPAVGSAFPENPGGDRPVRGDGSTEWGLAGHPGKVCEHAGPLLSRHFVQNMKSPTSPSLCVRRAPRLPRGLGRL